MIRRMFLVSLAVVSILGLSNAHAARTVTYPYQGGFVGGPITYGDIGINVGGASFNLEEGETLIDVWIDDDFGDDVAFRVTDGDDVLASGCGSVESVEIPEGTEFLNIDLAPDSRCESTATFGTISATLR